MPTKAHLWVVGCRIVAFDHSLCIKGFMSALDVVFLGNNPLCLLPVKVFSNLALLFLGRHLLISKDVS
jgi:hypothetical protein